MSSEGPAAGEDGDGLVPSLASKPPLSDGEESSASLSVDLHALRDLLVRSRVAALILRSHLAVAVAVASALFFRPWQKNRPCWALEASCSLAKSRSRAGD